MLYVLAARSDVDEVTTLDPTFNPHPNPSVYLWLTPSSSTLRVAISNYCKSGRFRRMPLRLA